MMRGAFGNTQLKNLLLEGVEGSVTIKFPEGAEMSIYDAAMKYKEEGTPLIVIAGKEYGAGSSRDWAAKGPLLLGVKAVVAESYERIHRANLVGMGVLPLQFQPGENLKSLGLRGRDVFDITGVEEGLTPNKLVDVTARRQDGSVVCFKAIVRINSRVEVDYYVNGGILQTVLRKLAQSNPVKAS
jgi:aconitate hydratase